MILLPALAAPLPGQIIRDPEHPQWLMRAGGDHVFICGPGDPEGFLYLGARQPNGTRDGDQMARIDKLIAYGGNSIYLQTIRGFDRDGNGRKDGGGDGAADENPFVDGDYRKGADAIILEQWASWFTRMDEAGILIYLFLYDDDDAPWPYTPGQVAPGERDYVETVVNRFKGFKNLIWIVGEEHDDADYVNDIASIIAEADEHEHLIGNHHNSSIAFKTWRPGTVMTHHAMQYAASTGEVHQAALDARALAEAAGGGNAFQVIYSESTGSEGEDVDDIRHYNWNIAMAGVMAMRLGMMIDATPPEALQQCRILQRFFESTDFYTMANRDELARGAAVYVLAGSEGSFITYAAKQGDLGVNGLASGKYDLTWVDCVTGKTVPQRNVAAGTPETRWARPRDIGTETAVWIRPAANAR